MRDFIILFLKVLLAVVGASAILIALFLGMMMIPEIPMGIGIPIALAAISMLLTVILVLAERT